MSHARKRGSIAKVTYLPEGCILNIFNVNDYLFKDILSSSLCFVISLPIRSLQARPVKSIFFSSVLNAWLRIPVIDSQSTVLFGFLAVTSVANIMSLFIECHLKGAILSFKKVNYKNLVPK